MLENEEEFETVTIEEAEGNVCYLCAEPLLREGYEESEVKFVRRVELRGQDRLVHLKCVRAMKQID